MGGRLPWDDARSNAECLRIKKDTDILALTRRLGYYQVSSRALSSLSLTLHRLEISSLRSATQTLSRRQTMALCTCCFVRLDRIALRKVSHLKRRRVGQRNLFLLPLPLLPLPSRPWQYLSLHLPLRPLAQRGRQPRPSRSFLAQISRLNLNRKMFRQKKM
jgi:hypothetical protein